MAVGLLAQCEYDSYENVNASDHRVARVHGRGGGLQGNVRYNFGVLMDTEA